MKNQLVGYAAVLTLGGNLILKPIEKVRDSDDVDLEFWADTLADIKAQFKAHKADLKREGLL